MDFQLSPQWSRNRWFGNFFEDDDWFPHKSRYSGLTLSEDNANVFIEAAVPGVDPNHIEATFSKGTLSIRGSVQKEESDERKKYYRKASQNFNYQINLPEEVDPTQEPELIYKDGIIKAIFKKTSQASNIQRIPIKRS